MSGGFRDSMHQNNGKSKHRQYRVFMVYYTQIPHILHSWHHDTLQKGGVKLEFPSSCLRSIYVCMIHLSSSVIKEGNAWQLRLLNAGATSPAGLSKRAAS